MTGDAPAAKRARRDVDGILLLDKPPGMTSNRAVQRLKWLYAARKCGHTGTLDPLATGMLAVCLGQATKVAAYLLDADKVYRVRLCFGSQTATGDTEGPVIRTGAETVSEAGLRSVLASFRGTVAQTPPMYSALKREGRPLYELARAGLVVHREPRSVLIHELSLEHYDPTRPVLRVHCGKGTYIRSLVEDIAEAAGTVAHVAELRRLTVSPFSEEGLCSLQTVEEAAAAGTVELDRLLQPTDMALGRWPALHLSAADALKVVRGQAVADPLTEPGIAFVRLYGEDGRFLGVGERLPDRRVQPRRLMLAADSTGEAHAGL